MEAIVKVVSRSSKVVPGRPEIAQTVQVVISATLPNGRRLSITKHLRYQGGQYVGRAYDYRQKSVVQIAFPLSILSAELKEEVRLKAA